MLIPNRPTRRQRLALAGFIAGLTTDAADTVGRLNRLAALAIVYDAHQMRRPATVAYVARNLRMSRRGAEKLLRRLVDDRLIRLRGRSYVPAVLDQEAIRSFADRQIARIHNLKW